MNETQSQTRARGHVRPGYGDLLLRGFLWGTAIAVGTAIAGPIAPVLLIAAKGALGGGDDDGAADLVS